MSKRTHIPSDRLSADEHQLSHCGMYQQTSDTPRNRGNDFEWAERPAKATCQLCRTAVGLPKTIALFRPEKFVPGRPLTEPIIALGKSPDIALGRPTVVRQIWQMECWTPDEGWVSTPRHRFQCPMSEEMSLAQGQDCIRSIMAQCGGWHVLLISQPVAHQTDYQRTRTGPSRRASGIRFGMVRRRKPTFVDQDHPAFQPDWDLGSHQKSPPKPSPKPKSAWERLMGEGGL